MTAREYARVWLVAADASGGSGAPVEHVAVPADRVAYVIEVDDLPQARLTTPEWSERPHWETDRRVVPVDQPPGGVLADALDLLALHRGLTRENDQSVEEVYAIAEALAEADDAPVGGARASAYYDAARLALAAGLRLPADGPVPS